MGVESKKRAIVLSGGGARGAYAAGVIRYIMEVVSKQTSEKVSFEVISGTSVGAINAGWLAANIHDPEYCSKHLWHLWQDMDLKRSVSISYKDTWTMMRRMISTTSKSSLEPKIGRSYAVLDTSFISNLVRDEIDCAQIGKNIENGYLAALTISATEVHTGFTNVFVQSGKDELPPWTKDERRVGVHGPISHEKILASSAIPILFPSVKVGDRWYFDGGLRQNTPVSPALRMGATKLLVISLSSGLTEQPRRPIGDFETPTVSFLLGKVMNSLLLDPLDYDLAFLDRINSILESGTKAYGEPFLETLNEVIRKHRGQGYRKAETLLIRPSEDLGQLAGIYAGTIPEKKWGSKVLAMIGKRVSDSIYKESDFLSYLLFDRGYTEQLLKLGFQDAKAQHDSLVSFFDE